MSQAVLDLSPALTAQPTLARGVTNLRRTRAAEDDSAFSILVHSHLLWDWVWQRPQQFISRLSLRHPVAFVEMHPPSADLTRPEATVRKLEENLSVIRVQFPLERWNDGAYVDAERARLVREVLQRQLGGAFENPVQWFYDPMAVEAFAGKMNERATVYDCMDELSQFRGAPPEIIERERRLLALADVVFAGGRKLWESKKRFNSNCHFYGCGVDVEHFQKAASGAANIPADVASLRKPILGYIGVVDERLDYELIPALADAHPEWNIVIIGPATKIDASALPQRENIHWMGGRPYADLPGYARAFDVCLMPFALNEATEYINPTKALEYMATQRPVVSTAVADVVSNFSSVVEVASGPQDFIRLCEKVIGKPDRARIAQGLQMAQQNTWERTVAKLEQHVLDALNRKAGKAVPQNT